MSVSWCLFCVKQKTAYEMRISDWSSDGCSSDLGVFIVWDKMFGSFVPERDDEPVRYGIVKQLGSFNILWAAVHEWVGIAKDVWTAPWRHKLSYMWRVPGWSHDGSRQTSAMIKGRWVAGRAGGGTEERRVGKECVSESRDRGATDH